jgi:hypothetical protein
VVDGFIAGFKEGFSAILLDDLLDPAFARDVGGGLGLQVALSLHGCSRVCCDEIYCLVDKLVLNHKVAGIDDYSLLVEGSRVRRDASWNFSADIAVVSLVCRVSDKLL